jgi:glycosyltransferase involved in cell wall biosynthesis
MDSPPFACKVATFPPRGKMRTTRCDLHIHSAASLGNDEWYTRLFGWPESYAEPARQYDLCKARGMSLVTLTDHDTIDGGLTLIDRPDFFLSEEVTSRFPENGCVMHVLAWNITRDQHDEIQARRDDIYRLCEYLNGAAIAHGLAHPLISPNAGLDAATFEKVLLMFPTLEGTNGRTDRRIEPDLTTILERLTPEVIAALARKHGITPNGPAPHRKALTAGSDDHGARRSATIYTEVDGADLDPAAFLRGCMAGLGRTVGNLGKQAHLAAVATCACHARRGIKGQLLGVLAGRAPASDDDAGIVDGTARGTDKGLEPPLRQLAAAAKTFDIRGVVTGVRNLFGGLRAAVPVLVAANHFGKQASQVRKLREQWTAFPLPAPERRLALFSDSLEQVDGVSTWCKRFVARARAAGHTVLLPQCCPQAGDDQVPAFTSFAVPLYPCMRFHVPSLTRALEWAWRQRVTHIELATPGPMGLAGLLIAKLLRLPVTASYHVEVLGLVPTLGGNPVMAGGIRRYLAWFYAQVDRVFVMSSRSRDMLIQLGIEPEKLAVTPMAVDPDDFSPAHRSPQVFEVLNLSVGDRPVVLSVGRLSKEKNLPIVVEAVARLQSRDPAPLLLLVGDGPERKRLEHGCQDKPFVSFLGLQCGDTLKRLYASAGVFVFASRVDTLGLVNVEAMLSGIPVAVPTDACIAEFVTHGVSAECYELGAAGLAAAIGRVLDDPLRAKRMAAEGRKAMIDRWEGAAASHLWPLFTQQQ